MSRRNWPTPGPFKLPLSAEQFTSALRKGQGRVFLHVRAHGGEDFAEAIVDACLHDRAYDPQCEGDRSDWLMRLAVAAGIKDRVARVVCERLRSDRDAEFWDATHRCRLALILAREGNQDARSSLYAAIRRGTDCANLIAAEEIVELDGAQGLLFVADRCGEMLATDPNWAAANVLADFDEADGDGAARAVLMEAATHNPNISRYLGHLAEKEKEVSPQHRDRDSLTVAEIIRDIDTLGLWLPAWWGQDAEQSQVWEVLERAFLEDRPERIAKYLRVLSRRALSSFEGRLLPLAEHPDARVRLAANRALLHYKHTSVRELALRRIGNGYLDCEEIPLLKRNYYRGDWKIIAANLALPPDEYDLHGLLMDLCDLFAADPIEELDEAMLLVYERTPCTNCRHKAVNGLAQIGLPGWIREECAFDAMAEIRELVGAAG